MKTKHNTTVVKKSTTAIKAVKVTRQPETIYETLQRNANTIVSEIVGILVTNDKSAEIATNALSGVKAMQKNVKASKDPIMQAIKQTENIERARWKPIEDALATAETNLKHKLTVFMEEKAERQREEERKILDAQAAGKIKQQATVDRKLAMVEQAPTTIVTTSGASVQTRMIDHFEYDVNTIPREYLLPNETLIKAAIKTGKTIEGVTVSKKPVIAAR